MKRKIVTIKQYKIGRFALWIFVAVLILLQLILSLSGASEYYNILSDCSLCDYKSLLLATETLVAFVLWVAAGLFSGFTENVRVVKA